MKDKTYDPSKDFSDDDSYISNSPEHDISQNRINQVKKTLFTQNKLPEPLAVNKDLITLDDLVIDMEKCNEPDVSFNIFRLDNQMELPVQTIPNEISDDVINITSFQFSNQDINIPTKICNEPVPSTSNDIRVENYESSLCDNPTNEAGHTIRNTIMVIDINGTIYLPTEDISANGINIQQSDGTPLLIKSKKRLKNIENWKRVASKNARLKGSPYHSTVARKKSKVEGRELKPPCACRVKCYEKFSNDKRLQIFKEFWKTCVSWDQRRQFIVNNVTKIQKRIMKTSGNLDTDKRKFTFNYTLVNDSKSIKVCKTMFLNTLCIGEKFLKISFEKQLVGGLVAPDQRGKHTPSNKSPPVVIQSVIDHINMYPSYESHYSRQKSARKFLGPDLNIPAMYRQYKEWMAEKESPENLIAKEWLYRNIFNTKFNLSFKLPSVDTCDDCDAYQRKIMDAKDEETKKNIEKDKEVHDFAAEERYNLKKKDKSEADLSLGEKKVLMFDMQKCMATPNLTNSKSFYLRKLWTLNFTIFDSTTDCATNVIWSENIAGRGGNEVASCLIRWANENNEKFASLRELTFWSDNCAGQNRNLMVVLAYMWLLHKFPELKIINHKFMLKGHTHMEVDQIHSQIEQKKKRLKTMQIAVPRDWSQFIRTCGGKRKFDVFDMQSHHFLDFSALYKKNGPFVARKKNKEGQDFKISECVCLQVKQEQPGILYYKNSFTQDFSEISLIRNAAKPTPLPENLPRLRRHEKPISTAKYNDLMTLLQWVPQELHGYYEKLIHSSNEFDFPETD